MGFEMVARLSCEANQSEQSHYNVHIASHLSDHSESGGGTPISVGFFSIKEQNPPPPNKKRGTRKKVQNVKNNKKCLDTEQGQSDITF